MLSYLPELTSIIKALLSVRLLFATLLLCTGPNYFTYAAENLTVQTPRHTDTNAPGLLGGDLYFNQCRHGMMWCNK